MITEAKIQEVVRRIVAGYDPDQIILFGSYARGTATDDSDLDLLVVKDTEENALERDLAVLKLLRGQRVPIDILVYTQPELQQNQHNTHSFEYNMIHNGKLLYERTA